MYIFMLDQVLWKFRQVHSLNKTQDLLKITLF